MLIINLLKPFYIDKDNKIIRMGNFKDNAKEIEYEDESLLKIFENIKEPISKKELIEKVNISTGLSKEDISEAIDYLIEEKFIIDYDNYQDIINEERFNRQNLFFAMVSDNMNIKEAENNARILILGIGGVGANVALTLARSGFENITIVDCDKVELSNLIRQLPYSKEDIGKYKTEVLLSKLKDRENMQINCINKKILSNEDIEEEIKKSDFVICTLDKPVRIIRRMINDLCVKYKKPVIFSGFAEHVAMIGPFVVPNKSACLKCIDKKINEEPLNNVKIVPSYGPLCMLISSIVSNEVINYYHKFSDNNLIGKTMMFNILTYENNIIEWEMKKDCEVCGKNVSK